MTIGITLAPLLSLRIAHDYYDPAAVPIAFEPTPETAAALRRGCCRLRVTQDVAEIYAQMPFGAPPALDPAAPALVTFRLGLRDPDFALVTEPDWGAESARDALSLGPGGLDPQGSLPSARGRTLPVVARRGRVLLEAAVAGGRMALRALGADPADDPAWSAPLPPGKHSHLDLAADEVPEGTYRLEVDDQPLRDLILSDEPPARLYGLVTVPLAGTTPVGPRETPRTLTVRFRARAPRWRYVLQSRSAARDLGAAAISAPDPLRFAAPRKAMRNGRTVWLCESAGPIPLALRPAPARRIALTLPAEAGPPPPPRQLPQPGPANTALEQGPNGPEAWSTIYVTV